MSAADKVRAWSAMSRLVIQQRIQASVRIENPGATAETKDIIISRVGDGQGRIVFPGEAGFLGGT